MVSTRLSIGGAIAKSAGLFLPHASETLGDVKVQIVISRLSDHAALVGAGANWLQAVKPQQESRVPRAV